MLSPVLGVAKNINTPIKAIEESSTFGKSYNALYNFIQNHEYLLAPLSATVAGAIRCGYQCGVIGGAVGIIDELALYFGYTDKHYLSWGIFGAVTGHVIKSSLVSDIGGVILGIMLPTGVLNEHQEIIAPVIGAIAGNSIAGNSGMINGLVGGILDEALLGNDLADKHYLTFSTLGEAVVNSLGYFSPFTANAIGMLLGLIAASYEKEIKGNMFFPIKIAEELYATYSKFIPTEQLNNHIEKHAIALIGSQFLTQFLSLKIINYNQALIYNFERLDNPNGPAWGNFGKEIANFVVFLFPYVLGQIATNSIDDYFAEKLQFVLGDKIRAGLFTDEIPLCLSNDLDSTVLIDNLRSDILKVVGSGSRLITNAVSTSIGGAYGIGIIVIHSPNILIYSTLYNKVYNFIEEYLAAQLKLYREKITALNSELMSTIQYDTKNIRTITERDGIEATRGKIEDIITAIRELGGTQKLWRITQQSWWSITGTADSIFNYYLAANEIQKGRIPFEDRNKVRTASRQVSNLLSWSGRTAQDMSYMRESLNRIIILEGKIHKAPAKIDQITREYKNIDHMKLQDLEIGVADRLLVEIKDLTLNMGEIYAITGESGCGKTSLLSKIKGIKENNIYGKGSIFYPLINGNNPKIVMLSQQDYFPLNASLYEIVSYPDKISGDPVLNNIKREEIQLLLAEIGLYAFSSNKKNATQEAKKKELTLDSKQDWHTYLSGGEKKKVTIVSAILKKPNILILDEPFNGLDLKSIPIVQQMLKKYLPDTLILVVDHHAQDNNYNFYDVELRIVDKKVVLRLK